MGAPGLRRTQRSPYLRSVPLHVIYTEKNKNVDWRVIIEARDELTHENGSTKPGFRGTDGIVLRAETRLSFARESAEAFPAAAFWRADGVCLTAQQNGRRLLTIGSSLT